MYRKPLAVLVLCLLSGPGDPFAPVRTLEGSWQGRSEGFGGAAAVTHEWESIFDGKFVRLRTRSVSEDEEGNGSVREDVGYVSWSKDEKQLRFRHFLSEGFVNTFSIEPVDGGLNFEPESTEGYAEMAARLVLRFDGPDRYELVLELGTKGETLVPCQTVTMERVK